MYIQFEVEVESWVTSEADSEDIWDRDSTDGSVSVVGASLVSDNKYDTLPAPEGVNVGDTLYLIWAQYGTGDSFGSDGGKYELLEVCRTKEAAEERKKYYINVTDYSVPWNGYFEWLQSLNIEEFILEEPR